jgi:hypothetical protein
MAIRYNKELNTNINAIVRNYNAKISRLEKVAEELYLPEKTSVKEIKESAKNRQELNRILKDLQRYSKRGMEKTVRFSSGVEMSKYQSETLKRNLRIAKAKATRQLKNFTSTPIKVFGIPQNTPHEFDDVYINLKKQRENFDKNIQNLTRSQLNRLEADIESVLYSGEREEMYKENWIDMLEKLTYYSDISKAEMDSVIERMKKLSASNFIKLYRNEKSIKNIQERYQDAVRNKFRLDDKFVDELNSVLGNFTRNIDIILQDYE